MSRVFLSAPDVGDVERQALLDAFDGGWIAPVGPDLNAFEAILTERTGRHAVALASGTAALHLALLQVGVGHGDRVAVSTFTFAASANAVAYCGAVPIFIDSELTSWNMSAELLDIALSDADDRDRPIKAVVIVDLYGQSVDHEAIAAVCNRHGVPVVEDAAEALGASYRDQPCGSFGDVGVLSFNGNKIMTTSGGGALLCDDRDEAARARYLATQARQPAAHYEHNEIGFNYRLSNLLAALGTAQLSRLDSMIARRLEINSHYRSALAEFPLAMMPIPEWSGWNGWLTCVVFHEPSVRDRVMKSLDADDIESRPLWKPLHLQPAWANAERHVDGTSESLFEHGLCLPSGSVLTDEDLERVISRLTDAVSS